MKLTKIIPLTCSIFLICGFAYAFNKIQTITPPAEVIEIPPSAQFDPNATYYAGEYHPKLMICTQTDLSYQSVHVTIDRLSYSFPSQSGHTCTNWLDRKVSKTLEVLTELRDSEGGLLTSADQLWHTITNWNTPGECLIMNVNPSSYIDANPPQTITFDVATSC